MVDIVLCISRDVERETCQPTASFFQHRLTMIISKQNRRTIYMALFQEGVLVAPKNFEIKHPNLDVPNLEVIKALQSLDSKGYVHTQFSWQWFYYVLTDEGLEYLREYLHLPSEIVPNTHKQPARPQRALMGDRDGFRGRGGGDREYRRRGDFDKKDGAPSGDFRPRFGRRE